MKFGQKNLQIYGLLLFVTAFMEAGADEKLEWLMLRINELKQYAYELEEIARENNIDLTQVEKNARV